MKQTPGKMTIKIGMATCGLAAGAGQLFEAARELAARAGADLQVSSTGCVGLCYLEPVVEVEGEAGTALYGKVTPALLEKILQDANGPEASAALIRKNQEPDRDGVLPTQRRIALARCGVIDPESLDLYLQSGGFVALTKALRELAPGEVVEQVKKSGLRGRGGGGFPTGLKWSLVAKEPGPPKYVICNADEGDPGAFMDRSILEGDPCSVIEGMIICGYAVGADQGIIYCRAEYPRALVMIRNALKLAEEAGYLGDRILGSGFSFHIKVKEGAGAFVCGEETALMASVEGRRGMPRLRPPYPAQSGLYGAPTNINNVETFASVPWILREGAEAFAALGSAGSKGTKVFALAGKIRRGGLVEVPMGTSLRHLIEDIGGGVAEGRSLKAVQIGGPSGGCIPAAMFDVPIDYEKLQETGAIMGSGGMVVMDDTTCMVDVARYFLSFVQSESCGKCTFCRIGTKRLLEILERICAGNGKEEDLEKLETLALKIRASSLCGLGQTSVNPVLTTLRYFRTEYDAHIRDRKCPAHSCNALVSYTVLPELCTGCTACARGCPVGAIEGEKQQAHVIHKGKCIRCGRCYGVCPVAAIMKD